MPAMNGELRGESLDIFNTLGGGPLIRELALILRAVLCVKILLRHPAVRRPFKGRQLKSQRHGAADESSSSSAACRASFGSRAAFTKWQV